MIKSSIPSPCYILEEAKLRANLEIIRKVQEEAEIDIILAFKGFAMWGVFPILKEYIKGAAASSLNELKLCHEKIGNRANTYCVAYLSDEFEGIAKNSSHITFNSLNQYRTFIDQVPSNVSVGIRVNPEWSDVEADRYNPSNPTSRLGITSEGLNELPSRVEGLHFHVLFESDVTALENVLTSFEEKFGHLLAGLRWVNMGGGHLMTKKGYDIERLISLLRSFKEKHNIDIILEPGSAFAWEAGDLHTTVLDIVGNGKVKTAIIDASFTCHMPDCLEMPYKPQIECASRTPMNGGLAYRLGGASCLAGDYLDEYWFERELALGDPVVFKDMIHYTMVKTTTFNGIKHPSIGMNRSNGGFELIREFNYEDYKNRLS